MSDQEIIVDARGHRCPVPTLRLRRACALAPAGAVLRVLADDPMARIDIPHFARSAGLELLQIDADGPLFSIRLRKPPDLSGRQGCGAPLGGNDAPPG